MPTVPTKDRQRRIAQFTGLIGAGAVILSLWAAAIRFAEPYPLLSSGVAPFLAWADTVRSKTDLEEILGPPGSENRLFVIGPRYVPYFDFIHCWLAFSLFGSVLTLSLRPKLQVVGVLVLVLAFAAMMSQQTADTRLADAAAAQILTGAMAQEIRKWVVRRWLLTFVATLFNSMVYLGGRTEAKVAGWIFIVSVMTGILGITVYYALIAYAVFGMFAGLFLATFLLQFSPDSL